MQMPPAHPMGQYPPPMPSMQWNANPPLPGAIHPPGMRFVIVQFFCSFELQFFIFSPSIPPPPGTDLAPPGTFGSFDDDRFGKNKQNWSVPPPIPSGNFWNQPAIPAQPPLPSFLVPPPPPPAD